MNPFTCLLKLYLSSAANDKFTARNISSGDYIDLYICQFNGPLHFAPRTGSVAETGGPVAFHSSAVSSGARGGLWPASTRDRWCEGRGHLHQRSSSSIYTNEPRADPNWDTFLRSLRASMYWDTMVATPRSTGSHSLEARQGCGVPRRRNFETPGRVAITWSCRFLWSSTLKGHQHRHNCSRAQ